MVNKDVCTGSTHHTQHRHSLCTISTAISTNQQVRVTCMRPNSVKHTANTVTHTAHRWIVMRGDACERDSITQLCDEAAAEGVGRFNGLCATVFSKAVTGMVMEVSHCCLYSNVCFSRASHTTNHPTVY